MKKDAWVIEWSRGQSQFHIRPEWDDLPSSGGNWRTIGIVEGTFEDASKWVDKWLDANPIEKGAYEFRVNRDDG